MSKFIFNIKKYFNYAVYSAKAELKSEVADSYLNWLWWIVEPFCFMLIYTFIFGVVFKNNTPYFASFVFIGLTAWDFFNRMINGSVKLIINNYGLELKNEADINSFLEKKDYTASEKAMVLVRNYEYIVNFDLNNISNDIILAILENVKLNSQQQINFCEKYLKDNFNSEIIISLCALLELYNLNISYSLFFKAVSSDHITEKSKIILFNKYYKQFEPKELYEILGVLGHQTDKIIAKDLRTLNKSDDNETYLNILSDMGLLSYSVSPKRKNTFYISYNN